MQFGALARFLVIGTAASAFVACASTSTNYASGSLLTDDPVVPALPSTENDMLRRMSDPNILGHIAMADSVEVVMAKFAEQKTKDDAVLQFAREMDVDHSTNLQNERALAQRTGIGMHTIVGEMKASHMGIYVDSVGPQISELNLDHNYIMSQVQMHEHMLAELRTLDGVTRTDAVRKHIEATIPIVAGHLNTARDMAVKRGYIKKDSWLK